MNAISLTWYRFRATFSRRWGGYLALALLTGLVGGVAMASMTAARRTDSSYPRFLAGTNPSDLIVQPNGGGGGASSASQANQAYQGFLRQTGRLPDVKREENAVYLSAATLAPHGRIATVLQSQVQLIASADGMFAGQDRVTITAGRAAGRPDEIVASPRAAALLGLHVGSRVPVGIWSGTPQNVTHFYRTLHLIVVGMGVFNTQILQDDIDSGRTGFLLGTPALAREFGSCCAGGSYVGLQLTGGSRDDAAVEREYAQLENTSPFYARGTGQLLQVLQVYDTSAIEAEAQRAIRPEAIALAVFGVIAGLAALIIGAQSVSRQLQAGSGDAGILRGLGAGPAATAADALTGLLAAITAGSLLAVAVAVGLSPLTLFGPVRAVEPASGVYADWTVLGLGALILAAVLGALAAGMSYRLAPHRAAGHRPAASRGSGAVRAALAAGLPAPVVAGTRFALEPGRGRTAVPVRSVITGAILAAGVVMTTLTFGASLSKLVSHPALYGWNFDYALYSTDGWGPFPASFTTPLLDRDPSIESATGVYFLTVQIDHQTVPAILSPVRPPVASRPLTGYGLDGPGQIVLGPATLAQLHKRVGDSVTVTLGRVIRGARLRIAGTAALPTIGDTLGIHPSMGTGAILATTVVPAAVFRAEYGPDFGPNAFFVRLRPGGGPAGLLSLEKIARTYNRIAHSPRVVATAGLSALQLQASVLPVQRPAEIVNYRSMGKTPAILAGGLAAGAVAGLGLTLVASLRRRRRDFALLKTLGFTRWQLAAAIAWQSTVIAATGLAVGIPLGIAAGRWLWLLFAGQLSAVPDPVIPVASIGLAAAAALALANLVAAIPGWAAARTRAALALRSE